MAQPFFYEVRYLPESQDIYTLERVAKDGSRQPIRYEQDDKNWSTLLKNQKSFRFDGKNGHFSAIRETRKGKDGTIRGKKPYWSGYRKALNQQSKIYIGQDLSIDNLEKTAEALENKLKEKLGIGASDKIHNTRRLQAGSPEHQKIAYLLDQNEKLTAKVKRLESEIREKDRIISNFSSPKP